MVTLLLKEKRDVVGVCFVPADNYTTIYMKREIGVTVLTPGELDLLQMLTTTPGFSKFKIKVQEKDIVDDLKELEDERNL